MSSFLTPRQKRPKLISPPFGDEPRTPPHENDRDGWIDYIKFDFCRAFSVAPKSIRCDIGIAEEIVKNLPNLLTCFSASVRDNKDLVANLVDNDPCVIWYASGRLRDDRELVRRIVLHSPSVWPHLDTSLKKDREFMLDIYMGLSNDKERSKLRLSRYDEDEFRTAATCAQIKGG